MKRLIAINTVLLSVFICVHSLPTTSTDDDVIRNNTSCDVALDFSNMGLKIINPNFISNPYIKSLSLRYNGIESFQENTFDSLPSLEKLDLSNNALSAENLFSFGSMYALKSLNLDFNVDSLSTETSDNYNGVITGREYYTTTTTTEYPYWLTTDRSYPIVCSEDQYKRADGSCNNYSKLHVKYNYPNLTHLTMQKIFINSLAIDWADHFPKLSHLDMSENYFGKASSDVSDLIPTSVTSLTLRNSHLTALSGLNLKNLVHLNLDGNKFDALSNYYCFVNTLCLKNLINLESLHVADCSIKMIGADAFTDAKKLKYLDMSGNTFREIPDGVFKFLTALEHLNLSRTHLNVMPDLSNLTNLSSLYMDDMTNKWSFSDQLERISMLPNLAVLSLRSNDLSKISSNFFDKFPKLTELNLSRNSLTTLPSWQGQNNLRKLSLDYNDIKHLEDLCLNEAESLELLNLQGNTMTEIKIKYLKNLPDNVVLKI